MVSDRKKVVGATPAVFRSLFAPGWYLESYRIFGIWYYEDRFWLSYDMLSHADWSLLPQRGKNRKRLHIKAGNRRMIDMATDDKWLSWNQAVAQSGCICKWSNLEVFPSSNHHPAFMCLLSPIFFPKCFPPPGQSCWSFFREQTFRIPCAWRSTLSDTTDRQIFFFLLNPRFI